MEEIFHRHSDDSKSHSSPTTSMGGFLRRNDEDFIEDYMTSKERKILQEIKKENQIIDLFAGEY